MSCVHILVFAWLNPYRALVVEAQRARVLAHTQLSQMLQEYVARQHHLVQFVECGVIIKVVECSVGWRIAKRLRPKVKPTLLERHE